MLETAILMQMDEPMASLSVMQSVELLNYIKRMRSEGRSILHLSRFAGRLHCFRTHSGHVWRQKSLTRTIMNEGILECN